MASSRDASERLARVEQILSQTTSGFTNVGDDDPNAAALHLDSVPAERIRLLTTELHRAASLEIDETDLAVMKRLLDEYSSAAGHLRAVANRAAAAIDGVAAPIAEMERAVHRHLKTLDAHASDWLTRHDARK